MGQFQCVPNLSEGRRPQLVAQIVDRLRGFAGIRVADYSCDADHNRMVVTLIGGQAGLEEAVLALYQAADELLDLGAHQGEHPRLGMVDVVPFIPLGDTPMQAAVALARRVAERVAQTYNLPVFLYEAAAQRPERARLPDIRRGQLAGLRERMAQSGGEPDFGPNQLHPRLGATVIGARSPLVAYNVVLKTDDLAVAGAVARRVRERDGGLRSVRAIPIRLAGRGRVQVSMNLTDPRQTGLYRAFELVRLEARRYGVEVESSELIGLCPLETLLDAARYYLQLETLKAGQVLEHELLHYCLQTSHQRTGDA